MYVNYQIISLLKDVFFIAENLEMQIMTNIIVLFFILEKQTMWNQLNYSNLCKRLMSNYRLIDQ